MDVRLSASPLQGKSCSPLRARYFSNGAADRSKNRRNLPHRPKRRKHRPLPSRCKPPPRSKTNLPSKWLEQMLRRSRALTSRSWATTEKSGAARRSGCSAQSRTPWPLTARSPEPAFEHAGGFSDSVDSTSLMIVVELPPGHPRVFFLGLEHDPEKWAPVFRKRSCSNKAGAG